MPIDIDTPDSPGWWLKRCWDKLQHRRKRIDPLYARYEGKTPMPAELLAAPEPAQRFYRTARTNFAEMIVRAVRYRLRVTGILTAAALDDLGDEEAFAVWVRAGMASEQHDVHRNVLVAGDGYVLCAEYEGHPAATSEDPRQMVTIHDPVRQASIRAAAKFFRDADIAVDYAYLYRPDPNDPTRGRRWVAMRERKGTGTPRYFGSAWDWSMEHGGADGESVPVPMPVVRYRNEEGVGEFERHTDILDRIDHIILQGMVIATLQAFKQRAIKADPQDLPDTDDDPESPTYGQEIDYNEVFLADPGALWKLPQSAEMWESGAVDVGPIDLMATKAIERLSAVTFTPMSMFSAEAANQSATGASLVREGLTTKVEDKHSRLGESHVLTAALLGRIANVASLKDPVNIRVRWAPAERFGLAEKADAGVKAKASGMPWRTQMRVVWQMEPEDIARMETERMDDAMLLPAIAAPVQTTSPAGQVPA